jgi:hypothetical protein
MRYPADPPTVAEIVAVMRHTSEDGHGWRGRAMIVVLWRAGPRILWPAPSPATRNGHAGLGCAPMRWSGFNLADREA